MSAFEQQPSCVHPESLVLIEAFPLCRITTSGELWEELPADLPLSDEEVYDELYPALPLRCAAVMTCSEAFALLEEVGYVEW